MVNKKKDQMLEDEMAKEKMGEDEVDINLLTPITLNLSDLCLIHKKY